IKSCKTDKAKEWNVTSYPLSKTELYPNMGNHYDEPWKELKRTIAHNNHELTSLWYVGKKNRQIAHNAGIYDWMNKKCNAQLLGIQGEKGRVLDDIININRSTTALIKPNTIKNDLFDWKQTNQVELFVDFEFKNAVFDTTIQLPIADTSTLLFLIGVGYIKNNTWHYQHFHVNHLNESEEQRISLAFLNFAKSFVNAKWWHWSQ